MTDPAHKFTADWFLRCRRQFKRHLMHLAGRRCRILEIGCFEGRATCWLLENVATAPAARITCVDLSVNRAFWPNVSASKGKSKVDLKIGLSRDILPKLKRSSFDFIYIDGSHWTIEVLEDAVAAFRLAKVGAIIAFDDYRWDDPLYNQQGTPKPAIDAFLKVYKAKITLLAKNYQVWVRKEAD
jgi:predicted O-methyltransferase YrrM